MRGAKRRCFSVRERVEKLGIEVDNLCITVDKGWISARATPSIALKISLKAVGKDLFFYLNI